MGWALEGSRDRSALALALLRVVVSGLIAALLVASLLGIAFGREVTPARES